MNFATNFMNRSQPATVAPTNGSRYTDQTLESLGQRNAEVAAEALFLQDLLSEVNKVMVGQEALVTRVLIALLADGHVLLEGVPGLAKTLLVKTVAQAIAGQILPPAIHARPAARRPDRHPDLQSGHRRFQRPPRAALCQPDPGRRDQPGAGQGAERAAGSHAGAPDHDRRHNLQDGRPLPGVGDPEPDRAGGNLSAARGAGGPLHDEGARRLSPARGRATDAGSHDRCWKCRRWTLC